MAETTFKKTQPVIYPKLSEKITLDAIYWKNLEFPITVKQNSAVTHIEFNPVAPHDYAVTSSTKVQIFDARTAQVRKSLTRFKETARCASYRGDGQLMVAGGDEPLVRVFHGKKVLRELKGHTRAVHVTRFTRDNRHVVSGSDDLSVRLWDVTAQSVVTSFSEHQDYVRCGVTSQASSDIIVTGSYDHTVRMFDVRSPEGSVLSVNHGAPVESVLMFPAGGLFISAGGTVVKVWDAVAGGRLLTQFSQHHKTITSLCFASNHRRLVSASLDRHVKFHDVSTYEVVHSIDFPSAILSVAVSPTDALLTVGMSDGLLSIQHRRDDSDEITDRARRERKRRVRGGHWQPGPPALPAMGGDDVLSRMEGTHRVRAEKHDVCLRRFQYSKALDCVMDVRVRTKTPAVTVAVLRELIRRDGLRSALAGREDEDMVRIVTFILKNVGEMQYVYTLLDALSIIIDLYRGRADLMVRTREVMSRLERALEISVDTTLDKCAQIGVCDLILSAAGSRVTGAGQGGVGKESDLLHAPIREADQIVDNDEMDTANGVD